MMTKRFVRGLLVTLVEQTLIIGTGIFLFFQPTLHLDDHFTLRDGQTTVENMVWPVGKKGWFGEVRIAGWLPQPVPEGASQVVVRLKNNDSFSWKIAPWTKNDQRGPWSPGEEREIFRGSLKELSGIRFPTYCSSADVSKLHAQLSIDASLPDSKPVKFAIHWECNPSKFLNFFLNYF